MVGALPLVLLSAFLGLSQAECPTFDFEEDELLSCPTGWTCTDAAVVYKHPGRNGAGANGLTGEQFFEVGSDGSMGSGTSDAIKLPDGIDNIRFKRAGGADNGGLYVYDLDDNLLCSAEDGRNTDTMFLDYCTGLAPHAGTAVYIFVEDRQNSGWGKVYIDDIRFYRSDNVRVFPTVCGVGAAGDPHLALPHGGKADFRGEDKEFYNLLSSKSVSLNVKTETADFELYPASHSRHKQIHGSFMTEAHIVARTTDGKMVHVSVYAAKIGGGSQDEKQNAATANIIWANGTVWAAADSESSFKLGPKMSKVVGDVTLTTDYSSLHAVTPEFEIVIRPLPLTTEQGWERNVVGIHHRLDVQLKLRVREGSMLVAPHGIIGQAWDRDSKAIDGEMDAFPKSGEFTTYAMARGAIEGVPNDYKMASKYATNFKFSRFGLTTASPRDVATLVAAGDLNEPKDGVMRKDGFTGATEYNFTSETSHPDGKHVVFE